MQLKKNIQTVNVLLLFLNLYQHISKPTYHVNRKISFLCSLSLTYSYKWILRTLGFMLNELLACLKHLRQNIQVSRHTGF